MECVGHRAHEDTSSVVEHLLGMLKLAPGSIPSTTKLVLKGFNTENILGCSGVFHLWLLTLYREEIYSKFFCPKLPHSPAETSKLLGTNKY